MKHLVVALALSIAAAAAAQAPSATPVPGPSRAPVQPASRSDLWQLLTPEQREQLWRTLTPAQRADVWRGLQPEERREVRERLGPRELRGGAPWGAWRQLDRSDGPTGQSTMTAEERQQMREQVREAHRLRRERMEAERARGNQ
jgi:Spy/CpxP family protein refolding chaperone